eukprot:scaffold41312_cov28-Tisochrysis_lutea.AAC.1
MGRDALEAAKGKECSCHIVRLKDRPLAAVRVEEFLCRAAAHELWPRAQCRQPRLRGSLRQIDTPLELRLTPQVCTRELRRLGENGEASRAEVESAEPERPPGREHGRAERQALRREVRRGGEAARPHRSDGTVKFFLVR